MTEAQWGPQHRRWVAVALGAAWLASLGFPAAHLSRGEPTGGLAVLLIGWLGVIEAQPAWLGNPLLWIALPLVATLSRPRPATLAITGVALIVCGFAALMWRDMGDDSGPNPIVAFGIGFYLWMTAIVGGGIAALATALMEIDTI